VAPDHHERQFTAFTHIDDVLARDAQFVRHLRGREEIRRHASIVRANTINTTDDSFSQFGLSRALTTALQHTQRVVDRSFLEALGECALIDMERGLPSVVGIGEHVMDK
jgi:hypothetical protein